MTIITIPSDKRRHTRYKIDSLPTKLFSIDENRDLDFQPVNISEKGIGIYSTTPLPEDAEVVCAAGTQKILLEVVWSIQDWSVRAAKFFNSQNHTPVYRYGLKVKDDAVNLLDHIDINLEVGFD